MSSQPQNETAPATARQALTETLFANVSSDDAVRLIADLPSSCHGIMITGQARFKAVGSVRHTRPDLVVLAQPPDPSKFVASPDHLWSTEEAGRMFEFSLSEALDDQITRGCSLAMTPTGFIEAAASAVLKRVLTEAEALHREDTIVWLPLSTIWLTSETDRRQLIAALHRWDRHPVALSFGHKSNPLETKKALEGLAHVLSSVPGVSLFRTDHVGAIETLVRSGGASTFGLLPSHRRLNLPGEKGFAIDKTERRPSVGYPLLHRIMRSPRLAEIFVNTTPPSCKLDGCDNRSLDGYTGSDEDRYRAHIHNLRWVAQLHAEIVDVDSSGRMKALATIYKNASEAHARLGKRIGRQMKVPLDLRTLLTLATAPRRRPAPAVPIGTAPGTHRRLAPGMTTQLG